MRYAKISRIVSADKCVSPENVVCQIIDMCSMIALLERIDEMLYIPYAGNLLLVLIFLIRN